jgi:serine protease AprX
MNTISTKLCLICVSIIILLSYSAVASAQQEWEEKVVDFVMENRVSPENEFFIYLTEQADLSPADVIAYKREKGRFVYETLTETARRTQPPVIDALNALGVEYQPFWIANMILVHGGSDILEAMAQREDVAMIYGNPHGKIGDPFEMDDMSKPAPHTRAIEWNIERINAPEVWALGVRGQGVVVGHIDHGVMWDHPALINAYRGWDGETADHNYNWFDTMEECLEPCDEIGHGTPTLGIIVGDDGGENQIGVAPGAKWITARIDDPFPTLDEIVDALEWMIAPTDLNGENPNTDMAPDIVSNSWACAPGWGCNDVMVLLPVVLSLRQAGIISIVAAANDGPPCSTIRFPPAIYAENLTVGATNYIDIIQYWSSRGPVTVDGSGRIKPDICAPSNVRSSYSSGDYGIIGGTSSATPHVAGLAALLISANSSLSGNVDLVETIIRQSAVSTTSEEECGGAPWAAIPNNTFGWGLVDALAAYNLAIDPGDVSEPDRRPVMQLIQVAPNPCTNGTQITYQLDSPSMISINIIDPAGRLVRTLKNRVPMGPGVHVSAWDGCDEQGQMVATGVYMYQLRSGDEIDTGRLLLVE